MKHHLLKGLSLLLLIGGSMGTACDIAEGQAPVVFRDPANGIELAIPEGFITREVGNSSALDPVKVAVAPIDGGFPTLNIIVHPPLAPGRSPKDQIMEEYRLAGFTDVKLAQTLDAPPFWVALELEYTQGGAPFTAYVGTLPATVRSYLVTAIAPREGAAEGRALFMRTITEGQFDLGPSPAKGAASVGEVHSSRTMAALALLAATAIALWYWRAHHRRKRQRVG